MKGKMHVYMMIYTVAFMIIVYIPSALNGTVKSFLINRRTRHTERHTTRRRKMVFRFYKRTTKT